jgi:polysaccharide deacetylase family protein (PEP-CTERM system associated)
VLVNILTIDVEEYFHPTEVQSMATMDEWSALPSRILPQTEWILETLDRYNVRGTFFILGWIAHRHPELVRRIASAGHEIGCHSFAHQLVFKQTPDEFHEDLRRAVISIEDACGITPRTFRAPSYSITAESFWALEILTEFGFTHDSSIYPISHDRYGIPAFGRFAQTITTASGPIREVPVATAQLSEGKVAPVGGGGYLRLLPYTYTAAGIRRINRDENQPACIYIHPWELDPATPRLARGTLSRLRTYTGLSSMRGKFTRLLADFSFTALTDVHPEIVHCACNT